MFRDRWGPWGRGLGVGTGLTKLLDGWVSAQGSSRVMCTRRQLDWTGQLGGRPPS